MIDEELENKIDEYINKNSKLIDFIQNIVHLKNINECIRKTIREALENAMYSDNARGVYEYDTSKGYIYAIVDYDYCLANKNVYIELGYKINNYNI